MGQTQQNEVWVVAQHNQQTTEDARDTLWAVFFGSRDEAKAAVLLHVQEEWDDLWGDDPDTDPDTRPGALRWDDTEDESFCWDDNNDPDGTSFVVKLAKRG